MNKRIALAIFEFIFVICFLSLIIILCNKPGVVAKIDIDGIEKTGISDKVAVSQELYRKVTKNTEPVLAISNKAVVIEDSLERTADDSFKYTSFTVDLPELKQAYRIVYYESNGSGVITGPPIEVQCLEAEDKVYSDFDCK